MHLADLTAYAQAQQRLGELYADPDAWARKAIINVACSGKFLQRSHDRGVRPGDLEREALPRSLRRLPKLRRT